MTRRKQKKSNPWKPIVFRELRIQKLLEYGCIKSACEIPRNAVPVDPDVARIGYSRNHPYYYRDILCPCCRCGVRRIWKAADQQRYFEFNRAILDNNAFLCPACRLRQRELREASRRKRGHRP